MLSHSFRKGGRRFLFQCGIILIGACVGHSAVQHTFHVSPTGSGSAFSETQPGALTDVIARIKTVNTAMTGDIVVQMAGGWYSLTSTLAFDAACSGRNGSNVIFQGAPGEYPLISGGKKITGWTIHDQAKNIWKASAPAGIGNRQLYVNCVRAIRARKSSSLDVNGLPMPKGTGISGSGTSYSMNGASAADIAAATGSPARDMELLFTGSAGGLNQWREFHIAVSSVSVSGSTITFTLTSSGGSSASDWENAYGLIDQSGEWYFDKSANTVYYKPRTGENMSTAVVAMPCLEKVVSFSGTTNMQFRDITFAHGTWLEPNTTAYKPIQSGNSGTILGNVHCDAVENLRFERCVFKHLGGRGLYLSPGCKNNTIVGCRFTQISGSAIQIGGVSGTSETTTGNTVSNCFFHDGSAEFHDQAMLFAGYVRNTTITHNTFERTYYSAVSVGWGWGTKAGGDAALMQDNEVSYNVWKDVMPDVGGGPILGDGGPIYALSNQPGSKIHHNYVQNLGDNSPGALYCDEGSGNFELYQNLLVNVSTWLSFWTSTIHDNIVHDNFTTTSNMNNSGTNCRVTNTTPIGSSESSWPAGAAAIKAGAGLESAFAFVKDMKCACSGGGSSFDPNRPYITISPDAISLAIEKGTNAVSQSIAVTNGSGGTLGAITASIVYGLGATNWITLVKGGSGNAQSIALSFTASTLNIGVYSATLVITATGALPTSVECPIEISVDGSRDPDNPQGTVAGLDYRYYEGAWSNLPDFSTLTPVKAGTCSNFDLNLANRSENYALSFSGYVQAPTDAIYTFSTESDDGSKLYIGNLEVVDNDGNHGAVEVSGQIRLKAGVHAIRVDFFQGGGGQVLAVKMNGQTISTGSLFRTTGATAMLRPSRIAFAPQQVMAVYTMRGQRVKVLSSVSPQRSRRQAVGVFVTVPRDRSAGAEKRCVVVR